MEFDVFENAWYSVVLEDIKRGLYVFQNESGTGKTCLRKLLQKCHSYGEPVSAFSYEDVLLGISPLKICSPTDRLVVLDRYDMYQGMFGDEIRLLIENTSVLMDSKSAAFLPGKYTLCTLHMDSLSSFRIEGS